MLIYTKLNKVLPLIGVLYYQAIIPSSTSFFLSHNFAINKCCAIKYKNSIF
jgi:hypothetical protein